MQYTQNYKFKKPDGADQVNIQDFNENADKMDAELKKRPVAEGGEISSMIARFEDYIGSVTLPDAETALGNIKTGGKLSVLFQDVKAVLTGTFLKKYILKTMEEVMANTVAGRTADALLLKEINSNFDELYNLLNPPDLYLYENGVEYKTGFTLEKTGAVTGSKESGWLQINYPSKSETAQGCWKLIDGIDVTYYNRLIVSMYVTTNNNLYIGARCGNATSSKTITSSGTYTFEVDISLLRGKHNPYFYSENGWAVTIAEVHFLSMLLTT